jgi:alpha-beta hydrolase superfamily lysophospholipase
VTRDIKAGDGLRLALHEWRAEVPEGVVALLHGYGEHAGRYDHVAHAFASKGLSTVAADLRGHGASDGARGYVDRFDDYHLDATATVEAARELADGRPVFLFGHSMGGLLAAHWLLAGCGKDLIGVALSSPYLGLALEVPKVKEAAGRLMSQVLPKFAMPSGLSGANVTSDPEKARLYDTDPLNNSKATARWFTEANAAIARVHERAGELTLPTILLYGGSDQVASADATDRFASALSMSDKTTERLAGYNHELVNEPPAMRDPVIERYGEWFLTHLPASE